MKRKVAPELTSPKACVYILTWTEANVSALGLSVTDRSVGIGRLLDFFLRPVNRFSYFRAKHNNSSNHKSKSFDSSRQFAVFVWRGFGENGVE